MNTQRSIIATVSLVVFVGMAAGAGGGAASPSANTADEVFSDPANDNPGGLAPDVTRVVVSLSADEVVSIRVETPNRTGQLPSDAVVMYINSDLDSSTGQAGSDHRIEAFGGDPGVFLARWSGSSWDRVSGSSFAGTFAGGITASAHRRDLGGTKGFSFFVVALSNGRDADYVPDDATAGGRATAKLDGSGSATNPPPPVTGSELSALVAKVKSGVIRVETRTCDGRAIGTGSLIAPGLIATVEHVVAGARSITVRSGGKSLGTATVIGRDPTRDLALLRTSRGTAGFTFRLARRLPDVGESVAALGYPLGLPLTATRGTVSGLNRTILINGFRRKGLIQTDAAVNRGNSGGPLLSIETGEVIGLVDLRAADASGIAFAVSSKTATPLLERWSKKPEPVAPARCT